MRYKFVEMLVRIAEAKYIRTDKEDRIDEAFERLMEEVILENYAWEPWMEFRKEKLWTLEVNDVLTVNMEGLALVQKHYHTAKRKYMTKKDAIALMTKDTPVGMNERDTLYCYGMSKMTIIDEKNQSKKYNRLELVEFAEFIGRVADLKYKDSLQLDLGQKIEFVLDDIFLLIDYKRHEKEKFEEECSESDDDY